MFGEAELNFAIFVLYSLAEKWGKTPPAVYNILVCKLEYVEREER